MREKILLDTDIGSDIDDAIALAYLLSHPDCEIVGITTVSGEAEKRSMIAEVICEQAGKNIVAWSVNPDSFFSHFFETFENAGK